MTQEFPKNLHYLVDNDKEYKIDTFPAKMSFEDFPFRTRAL